MLIDKNIIVFADTYTSGVSIYILSPLTYEQTKLGYHDGMGHLYINSTSKSRFYLNPISLEVTISNLGADITITNTLSQSKFEELKTFLDSKVVQAGGKKKVIRKASKKVTRKTSKKTSKK